MAVGAESFNNYDVIKSFKFFAEGHPTNAYILLTRKKLPHPQGPQTELSVHRKENLGHARMAYKESQRAVLLLHNGTQTA